ncbi:hypothetical protein BDF21DRAFT_350824, partial [Thamnidium elegans]
DFMDFITMSNKEVRLVVIDYAGLNPNPDDMEEFVRLMRKLYNNTNSDIIFFLCKKIISKKT